MKAIVASILIICGTFLAALPYWNPNPQALALALSTGGTAVYTGLPSAARWWYLFGGVTMIFVGAIAGLSQPEDQRKP